MQKNDLHFSSASNEHRNELDDPARSTDFSSNESGVATPSSSSGSRSPSLQTYSDSDFHRWRPRFHVIAAHGWMNDPCAPGYHSDVGLYSLGFQCNPYGYKWGNMSWGSALSRDLVEWVVSERPAMEPTETMDVCGVFTGCLLQKDDSGNTAKNEASEGVSTATAFYTSAQHLPITYKEPYLRGSERLHIATSTDNGRSWIRSNDNIVLAEPPCELGSSVRSWRDPFVGPWRAMDRLFCRTAANPGLYGIISGSIHRKSPAVFLYKLSRQDIRHWEFLGQIIDLEVNFHPSSWSGDFGVNWEVSNFVELTDPEGSIHTVLINGVEGVRIHPDKQKRSEIIAEHKQMWMCGVPDRTENGVHMQYKFGGFLDHGCFYAANGFRDHATGNFITFGWIFEEDLEPSLVAQQGWSGCLSVPRVVSMSVLKNVTGCLKSDVKDITCVESIENDGVHTLRILNVCPDLRLKSLRSDKREVQEQSEIIWFDESMRRHWEFKGSFEVGTSSIVGMEIAHDQGKQRNISYRV